MKNAFRTTGSILAAALVAWFAVAVTPAEAYSDSYGFDYEDRKSVV